MPCFNSPNERDDNRKTRNGRGQAEINTEEEESHPLRMLTAVKNQRRFTNCDGQPQTLPIAGSGTCARTGAKQKTGYHMDHVTDESLSLFDRIVVNEFHPIDKDAI